MTAAPPVGRPPIGRHPGAPHPILLPDDAADQRLVEQVHPAAWRNPTPAARYHLVVVGAGTGGLVTAAAAAGLGARVALVERSLMGGDCLNVGCVPSKSVIRAARAWADARGAAERFAGPRAEGEGDFGAVMERLRGVRAGMAPVDGAPRFQSLGVDVFFGDARFVAPDAVEVDASTGDAAGGGARLRFRRAVIAAGARASVPDVPGLRESAYYTNETIFSRTERPAHFVVLGGGPIGCELAQAFARLGARVTLLDRGERLLARDDAEAAAIVERAMTRDGVTVLHGAEVARVDARGAASTVHVRQGGRDLALDTDALLVAVGRTPNVNGLGLDAALVRFDARSGVTVDDRLRTTNPRVYAVGDVCSALKFTHAADFQARLVVQNALFFGRGRASALVTPWVTYTSPEVAQVGLTHEEAASRNVAVDEVSVPFTQVDRAVIDDETEGFCRILLARGTDRIVGATLVGAHAGETIGEVTLAMTNKLGLSAIGRTMHPYPTQSEALRKAADAWRRRKLTPRVRGLFDRYFRVVR